MRLNRFTRMGLAALGVGALLWIGYLVFGRSSTTPPDSSISENPTNSTQRVSLNGGGVFVAADDVPERSIITNGMFVPDSLSDGVSSDPYVTDVESGAIGFITRRRISRGERLRKSDLVGHVSRVGVAGAVRPGLRAMVVPILNKPTLHDLVRIGDYVDIIASFDQQESRTIVENVRVLAVDVFGKDFPQVRIAARGDYKADPEGIGTASTPSATGTGAPATAPAAQPQPGAAPPPQPTSAPSAPPVKPEASLTLEVTPQQATALSLAQASSAPLDYIMRPRDPGLPGGGGSGGAGAINPAIGPRVRVAATIKPQVAPYAVAVKNRAAAGTTPAGTGRRTGGTASDDAGTIRRPPIREPQNIPSPLPVNGGVTPMTVRQEPETYKIPIYGDGKMMREDTVRKPGGGGFED